MEFAVSHDAATAVAIGRRLGLSAASARKFARLYVNAGCALCNQRVSSDERAVRKVAGTHYVFHERCTARGALRLRAEAAAARTPAAYARQREAGRILSAARRRRYDG